RADRRAGARRLADRELGLALRFLRQPAARCPGPGGTGRDLAAPPDPPPTVRPRRLLLPRAGAGFAAAPARSRPEARLVRVVRDLALRLPRHLGHVVRPGPLRDREGA